MKLKLHPNLPLAPICIFPKCTDADSPYLGKEAEDVYMHFVRHGRVPDYADGVSGLFYDQDNDCLLHYHASSKTNKIYIDFFDKEISEATWFNSQIIDFND